MAFKRSDTAIEPLDLTHATPAVVERRILDGVKRYASHTDNWSKADKNTPFLGHLIGMGIESANLVDITMSIERQFLTRKTKRVPLGEDGSAFRLETSDDGKPGKLMILEGEDAYAATPGLAIKMLMDVGHMPTDRAYLEDVVSFPYVVVIGEGYRLYDSMRKLAGKIDRIEDPGSRAEAVSNLKALFDQAREYAATVQDPAALARTRKVAYERERLQVEGVETELAEVVAKLAEAQSAKDESALESLRARQVALRLRLNTGRVKLRVAEEVARHSGLRNLVEEAKVQAIRQLLLTLTHESERTVGAGSPPSAGSTPAVATS
jgi:hypothetical protein